MELVIDERDTVLESFTAAYEAAYRDLAGCGVADEHLKTIALCFMAMKILMDTVDETTEAFLGNAIVQAQHALTVSGAPRSIQ